jgi:hypothetical protein
VNFLDTASCCERLGTGSVAGGYGDHLWPRTRDGLTMPSSAIRAAPRMPILSGAISAVALLRKADAGAPRSIEQHGSGNLEALDAAEADVLVLDVDEHVRVDDI